MSEKPPKTFADEVVLPDVVKGEEDCTREKIEVLLGMATDMYEDEFTKYTIDEGALNALTATMGDASVDTLYNSLRVMLFDDMYMGPQTVLERRNKLMVRKATVQALKEKLIVNG